MVDFWKALLAGLAGDEHDRGCLTVWFSSFATIVVMLAVLWLYDWFVRYLYL